MDEKKAWENFARTGKVQDYIRYAQVRDQTTGPQTVQEIPMGERRADEVRSVFPVEVRHADQDPGAYHPGTDGGGERPSGVDPHP